MTAAELNDLAFELVEKHGMPTAKQLVEFTRENNISFDDGEYLLVFVKHWVQNKLDLKFADTYLNYCNRLDDFFRSED
jgi:hypothetical protein